jgi:F0F1-type ATP synthase delta subunit
MQSSGATVIYSADKLDPDEIDQLVRKFPFINKDSLKNVVDESILAGVRIHHGTKIIDLTLKNTLLNLKKKLYAAC